MSNSVPLGAASEVKGWEEECFLDAQLMPAASGHPLGEVCYTLLCPGGRRDASRLVGDILLQVQVIPEWLQLFGKQL